MTAQDIFDLIVTHLYTQGRRAVDPVTGACQYRTSDGLACAVGALLDDEDREACTFVWGVRWMAANRLLPDQFRPHMTLLTDLQVVHDQDPTTGTRLRADLRRVAKDYGLKYRAEHYPQPPKTWS